MEEHENILVPPGTRLLRDPEDPRMTPSREGWVPLLGIPWDWNITGRPGAREAPRALRAVLYSLTPHAPGLGSDAHFTFRDLGDVRVAPGDARLTSTRIIRASKLAYGMGAPAVFLGGDHSITRWTLEPLVDEGSVGVIVLDAHYDMRSVSEGLTSGSWLWDLYTAHGDLVSALIIGVADYSNPPYLRERAQRAGFTIVHRLELLEKGVERALEAIDEFLEQDHRSLYISIDADHLSITAAPGVNAPTPLGMEPLETLRILLHTTGKAKPRGIDVVEAAPSLDPTGATIGTLARLLAYAVHNTLARWGP